MNLSFKQIKNKHLFIIQIMSTVILTYIFVFISQYARTIIDGQKSLDLWQLVILVIGGVVLSFVEVYARAKFSSGLLKDFRNSIVECLPKINYRFFEQEHTGKIINKLNNDMMLIQSRLESSFSELITVSLEFLISFCYLLTVNAKLLLTCVVLTPFTILFIKIFTDSLTKLFRKYRNKMDDLNAILMDNISGINIAKSYNLQSVLQEKFDCQKDAAIKESLKRQLIIAISNPIQSAIRFSPTLICFVIAFANVARGEISGGEFVAFILLLSKVSEPIADMPYIFSAVKEGIVSYKRVCKIVEQPLENYETFGTAESSESENVIEVKELSFSYHDNQEVLKNLSFTLKSGTTTALVGSSGGGKSTVVKLICGLYEPSKGSILLYGRDLRQWNIAEARSKMAFVSQDVFLFPKTVSENIACGKIDATFDEIVAAAKAANAHDFIMQLPDGYNTMVGERGMKLSGGQKQRISIARAFLKDVPILLLDEMTSALDVESEKLIQESLSEFCKNRVVLVIAHRLSTIENADEILVVSDGEIAERGNHQDLLQQNGLYCNLYRNQFTEKEVAE